MHLLIMRHGEAQPYVDSASDSSRELTPNGRQQAQRAGETLTKKFLPDRVIVSPYVRTQQTAEVVIKQFSETRSLETKDWLVPDTSINKAMTSLGNELAQNLLVISHMPLVSLLAQALSSERVSFGTGSVAKISFLESSVDAVTLTKMVHGEGEFSWLV